MRCSSLQIIKLMNISKICDKLRAGSDTLALQTASQKNTALSAVISSIEKNRAAILSANAEDVAAARSKGMTESLVERLALDDKKINSIIDSIKIIISQIDPIGEETAGWKTPNGMTIRQIRVPLGVVAIIYESRPNVTADAFSLAYKSGNAILLRGSSSALKSNKAIVAAIKEGLSSSEAQGFGVPEAIELAPCESHDEVQEILTAVGKVDVALPRGGAKLINMVVETAKVPVIQTGAGVCHLYVDESANLEMAEEIAWNAKTQRPGACNAIECILVNEKVAEELKSARKAGLDDEIAALTPKTSQSEEVKMPPSEPTDDELHGIDVLEIDNAVKVLWKEGIYAESAMGCTGPVIKMPARHMNKAAKILKSNGYL